MRVSNDIVRINVTNWQWMNVCVYASCARKEVSKVYTFDIDGVRIVKLKCSPSEKI